MHTDRDGRHVLVGVTGGIAAYKTAGLVSMLVQQGHDVSVAMTPAATKFVGAATFEALSGRPVFLDSWTAIDDAASQHVSFAARADIMIVAPCSMNSLAKFAHGFASDALSLLVAAVDRSRVPVLLAPAMNAVMWSQPSAQRNIELLRTDGFTVLEPSSGWQACRTEGCGRMPEPEELLAAIAAAL
ncbi:MAG: phosphopantothenoylcysteine decarboxylase [Phycisphaerae bacterium]|jgi:phosphopantothenoylcysteine synthetase/decarboxylase|nr:phosphopantothenoylcysteine decarboxylase [Phycisphaerae bacterium]